MSKCASPPRGRPSIPLASDGQSGLRHESLLLGGGARPDAEMAAAAGLLSKRRARSLIYQVLCPPAPLRNGEGQKTRRATSPKGAWRCLLSISRFISTFR